MCLLKLVVELLKYVGGTWWVVFEMLCKQWLGFSWVDNIHPKSESPSPQVTIFLDFPQNSWLRTRKISHRVL